MLTGGRTKFAAGHRQRGFLVCNLAGAHAVPGTSLTEISEDSKQLHLNGGKGSWDGKKHE